MLHCLVKDNYETITDLDDLLTILELSSIITTVELKQSTAQVVTCILNLKQKQGLFHFGLDICIVAVQARVL